MPQNNTARQSFKVVMVAAGSSGGTADRTWSLFSGGDVDFPQLPVVDTGGPAAGPILGGPALKPLTLSRALGSGQGAASAALREHLAAIVAGTEPLPLDITIQEDRSPGRSLTYRRAYLRRWRIDPFDVSSEMPSSESYEFLASELEIDR